MAVKPVKIWGHYGFHCVLNERSPKKPEYIFGYVGVDPLHPWFAKSGGDILIRDYHGLHVTWGGELPGNSFVSIPAAWWVGFCTEHSFHTAEDYCNRLAWEAWEAKVNPRLKAEDTSRAAPGG